jgi:hypothetical protein
MNLTPAADSGKYFPMIDVAEIEPRGAMMKCRFEPRAKEFLWSRSNRMPSSWRTLPSAGNPGRDGF